MNELRICKALCLVQQAELNRKHIPVSIVNDHLIIHYTEIAWKNSAVSIPLIDIKIGAARAITERKDIRLLELQRSFGMHTKHAFWFESVSEKIFTILCEGDTTSMEIYDHATGDIISKTDLAIDIFVLIFKTIMEYKPDIVITRPS
jgi:hypothetical protein